MTFDALRPLMIAASADPSMLLGPDADTLLNAMRAEEAEKAFLKVMTFPVFWWHDRSGLTVAEKKALGASICRLVAAGVPRPYAPHERARIAALLLRFNQVGTANFQALIAPIDEATLSEVDSDSAFDILTLRAFMQDWLPLANAAIKWLSRREGTERQRIYAADFLFLAVFHIHRRHGNRKLARAVPTPEAAIGFLSGHLPAGCKNMYIYKGLAKCLSGQVRASIADFAAANAVAGATIQFFRSAEHVLPWPAMAALQDRSEAEVAAGTLPTGDHPVDHHVRHDSRDGCLLISTDKSYFADFIDHLCESYGMHNPGGLLQLHCVRFRPEEARLKAIEERCNIRINFAVDHLPETGNGAEVFKGYCAGARYLWLPHYLARHDFVAIADIDGVIMRDLPGLWDGKEGAVLLATMMDLETERNFNAVWGNISAGIFAIRNLPEHRVYAHMLAHFMAERFDAARHRDEKFFFADQTALLQCFLQLRDHCRFATFGGPFFRQAGDTAMDKRRQDKKNWQQEYVDLARTAPGGPSSVPVTVRRKR